MASKLFQDVFGNAGTVTVPGFGTSKSKMQAQVTYAEQDVPLVNHAYYHGQPSSPKHLVLLERLSKLLHWSKIAMAASHVFSGLLSIFMEGVMFYVLYKFFETKNVYVPGRPVGPWARNTQLWPTYMLAAGSLVTLVLAVGLLTALVCRSRRKEVVFSIAYSVAHVGSWIVVSAMYRVGKTGKDLWGWSCTAAAQEIQDQIGSNVLNFSSLCKLQVSFLLFLFCVLCTALCDFSGR